MAPRPHPGGATPQKPRPRAEGRREIREDAMTEMSMREHVARALYKHDSDNASVRWFSWENTSKLKRNRYLHRADAAMTIMRQPTQLMLKAADDLRDYEDGDGLGGWIEASAVLTWLAMINAALSDKPA